MKRSVKALGFRVMEAESVEEAVAAAERVRPSLFLTEEDVPDFYYLTDRLREHPTLLDVPVVIVNPDAGEGTRYGDGIVLTDFDQLERFLVCPAKDLEWN
jgi:PleD family two-component response regulator